MLLPTGPDGKFCTLVMILASITEM